MMDDTSVQQSQIDGNSENTGWAANRLRPKKCPAAWISHTIPATTPKNPSRMDKYSCPLENWLASSAEISERSEPSDPPEYTICKMEWTITAIAARIAIAPAGIFFTGV